MNNEYAAGDLLSVDVSDAIAREALAKARHIEAADKGP